jgi:hypothetical protein
VLREAVEALRQATETYLTTGSGDQPAAPAAEAGDHHTALAAAYGRLLDVLGARHNDPRRLELVTTLRALEEAQRSRRHSQRKLEAAEETYHVLERMYDGDQRDRRADAAARTQSALLDLVRNRVGNVIAFGGLVGWLMWLGSSLAASDGPETTGPRSGPTEPNRALSSTMLGAGGMLAGAVWGEIQENWFAGRGFRPTTQVQTELANLEHSLLEANASLSDLAYALAHSGAISLEEAQRFEATMEDIDSAATSLNSSTAQMAQAEQNLVAVTARLAEEAQQRIQQPPSLTQVEPTPTVETTELSPPSPRQPTTPTKTQHLLPPPTGPTPHKQQGFG